MAAARRYWFALMVCGVLLVLSLPLYLTPGQSCRPRPSAVDGMSTCAAPVSSPVGILDSYHLAHPAAVQLYWPAALVAGSCALIWWYRRSGEGRRIVGCVAVVALLAGATTGLTRAGWSGFHSPSAWAESALLIVFNGATPLLTIGPALLALAIAERSAALFAFTAGYCALAYVFATHDSLGVLNSLGVPVDVMSDPSGIRQMLNLAIPAAILLIAAGAAYAIGAPSRRHPDTVP